MKKKRYLLTLNEYLMYIEYEIMFNRNKKNNHNIYVSSFHNLLVTENGLYQIN